jgi:hypothetical protein
VQESPEDNREARGCAGVLCVKSSWDRSLPDDRVFYADMDSVQMGPEACLVSGGVLSLSTQRCSCRQC